MDNNGFGLMHVWAQGDWVTRCVFAALVLMSVASWIVIVIKALGVVRAKGHAARVEGFWHSSDMAEGLSKLSDQFVIQFGHGRQVVRLPGLFRLLSGFLRPADLRIVRQHRLKLRNNRHKLHTDSKLLQCIKLNADIVFAPYGKVIPLFVRHRINPADMERAARAAPRI